MAARRPLRVGRPDLGAGLHVQETIEAALRSSAAGQEEMNATR